MTARRLLARVVLIGGTVALGRGFVWSDLACYAVGALIGAGVEAGFRRVG